MPCNPTQRRALICAFAASVSAPLACAETTAVSASKPEVVITVFPDYYVLGGRAIDDLNVLESEIRTSRPRSVRLDACGAAADHPQRAAAHRFRKLNLELRFAAPDSPVCKEVADAREIPASVRPRPGPLGIDDRIVDRWWHQSMP
jgi:hypothetical protein